MVQTMHAVAADGNIVVIRDVPRQPVVGYHPTGQARTVDTAPDEQVMYATKGNGNAVTELTDHETAVITSGAGGNASLATSQTGGIAAADRISAGRITGVTGTTLSPTGALGSVTSSIGGGVGGGVGRATDGLANTLGGVLSRTGGM